MTFKTAVEEIRNIIASHLIILGINELKYEIMQTPRAEFGDVTTNVAFLIAKKTSQKPSEIAKHFVEREFKLYKDKCNANGRASLIESANAHSAGYINFKLNAPNLASSTLTEIL